MHDTAPLMGAPDPRRVGLAVYALELVGADGTTRSLDLDGPDLAPCFHAGERDGGLHYRYQSGEIVVPAAAHADLAAPLMLRLIVDVQTLRADGIWIVRTLRVVLDAGAGRVDLRSDALAHAPRKA